MAAGGIPEVVVPLTDYVYMVGVCLSLQSAMDEAVFDCGTVH
jgi:hypothetical protein